MFNFAVAEKEKVSQSTHSRLFVVGCFEFCGPFVSFVDCREEAGVLAVLRAKAATDNNYQILNIYYTDNVKSSAFLELTNGDSFADRLLVAILYTQVLNAESATNLATYLHALSSTAA